MTTIQAGEGSPLSVARSERTDYATRTDPGPRPVAAKLADPAPRLQSLDTLRGIAALLVVAQHFCEWYPPFARFSLQRFRVGEFGVVLFFLCSGFVIPASLERRGSLRDLWIGRFFRLFPLYWFCLALTLALHFSGHYRGLNRHYVAHWVPDSALNMTMLQEFLGAPVAIGQSWTLAFELTFYLGVSALFVANAHRRSARISAACLAVSMVIGSHVAGNALRRIGPEHLVPLAVVLAVVATVWATRGRAAGPRWTAIALTAVIALLVLNHGGSMYQAAFYFGTMFFGTAAYRWTAGELRTRTLVGLGAFAIVAIAAGQLHNWSSHPGPAARYTPMIGAEILTYTCAYLLFMGAVLCRHKRFPRPLVYLGTISYSVYLNHSILLFAGPVWPRNRPLTMVVGVALTLAMSALTYRLIEAPSIALGRRLTRRRRPR